MLYDEDTILLSFFERHSEDEDEADLKQAVIKYVGGGNFGGKTPMEDQNTTGESIESVSIHLLSEFCLTIHRFKRHFIP